MPEDDEHRRNPSTRAADPISRSLMASAESHKDFVDNSQTLVGYLVNPFVDIGLGAAVLLAPLLTHWFLANITITVLVVLVEVCILLILSWWAWRTRRRHESRGKSETKHLRHS